MGEARRRKLTHGHSEANTTEARAPSGWALASATEQERLEALFRKLGIDFRKARIPRQPSLSCCGAPAAGVPG